MFILMAAGPSLFFYRFFCILRCFSAYAFTTLGPTPRDSCAYFRMLEALA